MVRTMCGVQLKDRKRSKDLIFGCNEAIDLLVMANSVCLYGHVLMREDGHVLRSALDFEVDAQRKKGKLKRTWNKQVEGESVKVGLRREDALFLSKWSVGVNQIAAWLRRPLNLHLLWILPHFKHWCLYIFRLLYIVEYLLRFFITKVFFKFY